MRLKVFMLQQSGQFLNRLFTSTYTVQWGDRESELPTSVPFTPGSYLLQRLLPLGALALPKKGKILRDVAKKKKNLPSLFPVPAT